MPHDFGSDGYPRLEATRALAHGQLLDTPYSLVMSIVALPLYHFGDILAEFNMFVLMIGLAAFAAILWRHVPLTILRRSILIVLAASMFGHHSQSFFGETLTAMCVTVGLAWMATNTAWLGTPALVVGAINAPATVPALFLSSAASARPPRRYIKAMLPALLAIAGIMLEFYIRRGNPFTNGYGDDHGEKSIMPYSGLPGFSYPFAFGILSILFSFGKGLALYIPGLWLMFKRTVMRVPDALHAFQRQAGWFVIGLVLTYAKWWSWPGGWFWGPRFFLFACIPASIAIAMHLSDEEATPSAKALTLLILGWSAWVGISGSVYGQLDMSICNEQPNLEPLCWYSPEFSALFRPFIVGKALSVNEMIVFAYSAAAGLVLAAPLVPGLLACVRALVTRRPPEV